MTIFITQFAHGRRGADILEYSRQLRAAGKDTDLVITVGEGDAAVAFPVHDVIVCAEAVGWRKKSLRTYPTGSKKTAYIRIPWAVDPACVELFIQYLYGEEVTVAGPGIRDATLEQMYLLAVSAGCRPMVESCGVELVRSTNATTLKSRFLLAQQAPDLTELTARVRQVTRDLAAAIVDPPTADPIAPNLDLMSRRSFTTLLEYMEAATRVVPRGRQQVGSGSHCVFLIPRPNTQVVQQLVGGLGCVHGGFVG